jgi:hypothetical protein
MNVKPNIHVETMEHVKIPKGRFPVSVRQGGQGVSVTLISMNVLWGFVQVCQVVKIIQVDFIALVQEDFVDNIALIPMNVHMLRVDMFAITTVVASINMDLITVIAHLNSLVKNVT